MGHLLGPPGIVGAGHHAVLDVALGQSQRHFVERGLHRHDLLEDVRAPPVVLDHALKPADLALDAAQPLLELLLAGGVAAAGPSRTATYTATGMTCAHCVASVTEEVAEVGGVRDVDVDLASGRLRVAGDFTDGAVRAAVAEAGYEVAA